MSSRLFLRRGRGLALTMVCAFALGGLGTAQADSGPHATITRTSYGVPHIVADDYEGLGYGYGYSFAQDNICEMANDYVTISAERSRYFGPDAGYTSQANGVTPTNLQSDFFYQRINDEKTVEGLLSQPPPLGPLPDLKDLIRGYVEGYNRFLNDTGVNNLSDPRCRGAAWVREITELDAWRRFFQLSLFASQGALLTYIVNAAPPTPSLFNAAQPASAASMAASIEASGWHGEGLPNAGDVHLGSNAVALGKQATVTGKGMLLGNPHFPWIGPERFTEFQLTIPGKFNVEGGALFGVPIVLIGHTDNVAWSHTVSTAWRFTPYELKLVPGDPTSYIYEGAIHKMKAVEVEVAVKNPDNSIGTAKHTFWETRYGPMFTGIAAAAGVNIFNWTPTTGYAVKDVNIQLRTANQFFEMDQAQSVEEIKQVSDIYQGIPWVNTIAADSVGQAYYADHSVVPHVTNDQLTVCINGPIGLAVWQLAKLPVLDGSTALCEWGSDPDAVVPGIFGPSNLPIVFRSDYTENSNDSYWLPSARVRLEGYANIIGFERTQRSLRTRIGLKMIEDRLHGTDGRPGNKFTLEDVRRIDWENRQYAGELWRDATVQACDTNPLFASDADACNALRGWDLHNNNNSTGAVLWQRFAALVLKTNIPPWTTLFDSKDPVNTPSGLNTLNPEVLKAFRTAIDDLRAAHIPMNAKLGDYQYRLVDNGIDSPYKIPIHGGPGELGNFNAIYGGPRGWIAGQGFGPVNYGSSFMQAVQFTDGCPIASSMLSYSESTDPTSPHYADQTPLFSAKQWKPMLYCRSEIANDVKSVTNI